MSPYSIRRTWKEGTYMRLKSASKLVNGMAARGINQSELARLAGVSRQAISYLATGKKDTSKPLTAERIAGALRMDLDHLYEVEGSVTTVDFKPVAA